MTVYGERRCGKCKKLDVTLKIDALGKTYAHCLNCGYAWLIRIKRNKRGETMDYTKGEWETELRANENIIRIKATPPNSFQTHQIGEVYGTHGEDLINARLIIYAPIMYEALIQVKEMFERIGAVRKFQGYESHRFSDVIQVLARVEGRGETQ